MHLVDVGELVVVALVDVVVVVHFVDVDELVVVALVDVVVVVHLVEVLVVLTPRLLLPAAEEVWMTVWPRPQVLVTETATTGYTVVVEETTEVDVVVTVSVDEIVVYCVTGLGVLVSVTVYRARQQLLSQDPMLVAPHTVVVSLILRYEEQKGVATAC